MFSDVQCFTKKGESRLSKIKPKLSPIKDIIKDAIKEVVGALKNKFATNYVRWGRTVCPVDAEIMYSGKYLRFMKGNL